jgi:hypothetical protein
MSSDSRPVPVPGLASDLAQNPSPLTFFAARLTHSSPFIDKLSTPFTFLTRKKSSSSTKKIQDGHMTRIIELQSEVTTYVHYTTLPTLPSVIGSEVFSVNG